MHAFTLDRRPRPFRVLCVGAHADDIEIGCGGLILSLIARSRPVHVDWIVLSADGARKQEAARSARLFLRGAASSEVRIRQFRDGFFPYDGGRIKALFERLKRNPSPDLVLTHYRDDRHQDHRVVSELTWNTFRDHWVLEYEVPKFDGDLGAPNFFVPLGAAACAAKVKHLVAAFASQRGKHWFSGETFMGLMRLRGMECRSKTGYAEAFYGRKIALDV